MVAGRKGREDDTDMKFDYQSMATVTITNKPSTHNTIILRARSTTMRIDEALRVCYRM